jgi:hypothetical protein
MRRPKHCDFSISQIKSLSHNFPYITTDLSLPKQQLNDLLPFNRIADLPGQMFRDARFVSGIRLPRVIGVDINSRNVDFDVNVL